MMKVKFKMDDLDLVFKGTEAYKGKKYCDHDISTFTICITSILLPVIHMMKLKVKLEDW